MANQQAIQQLTEILNKADLIGLADIEETVDYSDAAFLLLDLFVWKRMKAINHKTLKWALGECFGKSYTSKRIIHTDARHRVQETVNQLNTIFADWLSRQPAAE